MVFNMKHKRQKVFGLWQFHEIPEEKNVFSSRHFHENPEGKITSENTNNHDPYEKTKWTKIKNPLFVGASFSSRFIPQLLSLNILFFVTFCEGG